MVDSMVNQQPHLSPIESLAVKLNCGNWFERAKAAEALAQSGRQALQALIKASRSPQHEVRYAAVWALGEIGDNQAIGALCDALQDSHWSVRVVAVRALGEIGDQQAKEPLTQFSLQDTVKSVRYAALEVIEQLNRNSNMPPL